MLFGYIIYDLFANGKEVSNNPCGVYHGFMPQLFSSITDKYL